MEEDHRSYCRICAAACGIVVTVDGDHVVRVRGDASHPVSRGYTCTKGRGLPAWHHRADRLDAPRLRGETTGWGRVLDDLAVELAGIVGDHGADAIALYLATGLAYDAAGQVAVGSWLRSIGSRAFYTAATVDNAPVLVAAELVAGNAMLNPVWDPASPGLLVLVGTNPIVSHGYGTSLPDPVRHLREFRSTGGTVWVVDPRRTESAALADEHLAVRPGSDVTLLAAVAGALLADGADPTELAEWCAPDDVAVLRGALSRFTLERAADVAGVDIAAVQRLVADLRRHRGGVAVFCGTGTTMGADGVVVEWLRWVLLVLSGSLDRPGGMRFHRGVVSRLRPPRAGRPALPGPASRPELPRVAGQLPAVALVDEIESGRVHALVLTGGNPLTAFPEPDRVRAAFARLDVLVLIDVMDGELAELATHVLPATGQLERADLTSAELTSVRSGLQATRRVVDPVAERRPVWWMLASLARRMGGDLLSGADPDTLTDEQYLAGVLAAGPLDADEVFAAGPHGIDVPVETGWVRETMLPDGRWRIAPEVLLDRLAAHRPPGPGLVLVPRREAAWSNSVQYAGSGEEPVVRLHPSDAAGIGVGTGGRVTITSAHGTLTARVAVDDAICPGVVSVTHGRVGASPGRLTSRVADVDGLTTMPRASGLPVSIARARPGAA